ncbi:MAG TPA: hypothetical protein VD978_20170 [Azospirillum sp.]|nr:hypothetical protein [Azospirillum sp.]
MIPPRLPLALIAALAAVALSRPAAAQGIGCPKFDRPELRIDTQLVPLKRNFAKTLPQLQAMPGRSAGPRGAESGQVLGLAHATFGERWQIGAHYQPQPGGAVCAALSRLTVSFGFQERVVYVARELPQGSCIQREVLTHEMKHVAVDEALLKEFMPTFKRRLEAVVARQGAVRARSHDHAMALLRQPVDAAVKGLMQEFARERERRQAKVDTIEEYRRVSKSCNGDLAKYVKGQGRLSAARS